MTAFDYEPLYNKSKVYVERAISHHAAGEMEMCQLWASLALELLGKAVLARIHPVLVADPNDVDSIFAACGRPFSTKRRSIEAKTVFLRMQHINENYIKSDMDFCMTMANRRNAELHSGEVPFVGMREGAWIPKFWHVSKLMLESQGKTLMDWLGAEEAAKAEAAIKAERTAEIVNSKFHVAGEAFEKAFPTEEAKDEIKGKTKFADTSWFAVFGKSHPDVIEEYKCPVCGCSAGLGGERWREDTASSEIDYESWTEAIEITYVTTGFRCIVCKLHLEGREELDLGAIDKTFTTIEEREPDYEPDYGND
jgi:hypothetical protein